jgi:predicted O-linked N-acetylglucosamine transferase (SPINDLY family)
VVTLRGLRQSERMGYSILAHLGVPETVTDTGAEYVEIACRLATDRAYRDALSSRIRERVRSSGIADKAVYARQLEEAYLRALQTRMGSEP